MQLSGSKALLASARSPPQPGHGSQDTEEENEFDTDCSNKKRAQNSRIRDVDVLEVETASDSLVMEKAETGEQPKRTRPAQTITHTGQVTYHDIRVVMNEPQSVKL